MENSSFLHFFCLTVIAVIVTFTMNFLALGQQTPTMNKNVNTSVFHYPPTIELAAPPVLEYRCARGHHGNWISDSDIDTVFVWEDGTVIWSVAPEGAGLIRFGTHWYQAAIPPEKVKIAVQAIMLSFAKYPDKNRSRQSSIRLGVSESSSPAVRVHSSQHYESIQMDFRLLNFYREQREYFQSGNDRVISSTLKTMTSPHYRGLLNYYKAKRIAFSYREEEVIRCAAHFIADAEHILMMEQAVLNLLPSREGLEAKNYGPMELKKREFQVTSTIKNEESKFFYSPIPAESL